MFSTELIWGEKSSPKLQNYNPLLTATPKQFIYSLLKNKKIKQIKQVRIKYSRKWQNNNKTKKSDLLMNALQSVDSISEK